MRALLWLRACVTVFRLIHVIFQACYRSINFMSITMKLCAFLTHFPGDGHFKWRENRRTGKFPFHLMSIRSRHKFSFSLWWKEKVFQVFIIIIFWWWAAGTLFTFRQFPKNFSRWWNIISKSLGEKKFFNKNLISIFFRGEPHRRLLKRDFKIVFT